MLWEDKPAPDSRLLTKPFERPLLQGIVRRVETDRDRKAVRARPGLGRKISVTLTASTCTPLTRGSCLMTQKSKSKQSSERCHRNRRLTCLIASTIGKAEESAHAAALQMKTSYYRKPVSKPPDHTQLPHWEETYLHSSNLTSRASSSDLRRIPPLHYSFASLDTTHRRSSARDETLLDVGVETA